MHLNYSTMCKANLVALLLLLSRFVLQAEANWNSPNSSSQQLRRRMAAVTNELVICRVTRLETLYISTAPDLESTHQLLCSPIVDDKLLQIDSIIQLPEDMAETYTREIVRGQLIVSIADATLDPVGRLELGPSPSYAVMTDPRFDHHKERYLVSQKGTKTVAVVRISTRNSEPADSVTSIQETLFGGDSSSSSSPTISLITQIEDCSHGKLKLEQSEAGIVDITLSGRKEDYNNDAATLVTEAQLFLEQEGYGPAPDLADRVIFCLPEGFGDDWAARAVMNHWRMTMNNNWCLSLSASMHEMVSKCGSVCWI